MSPPFVNKSSEFLRMLSVLYVSFMYATIYFCSYLFFYYVWMYVCTYACHYRVLRTSVISGPQPPTRSIQTLFFLKVPVIP